MADRKQIMSYLMGGIGLVLLGIVLLVINFIFIGWTHLLYLNIIIGALAVIYGFTKVKTNGKVAVIAIIAGVLIALGALKAVKYVGVISLIAGAIAIFIGVMKVKENS